MKKGKLISILVFVFLFIIILSMYFTSPTKAEVERYFEENKCYSGDYCVYYMRRNTANLWGQVFKIPVWWVLPNFILYTTTPFNYYHDIELEKDMGDYGTYTWIDTREGRFVYNAVNGEYIREIDDKEDPAKKWTEDMSNMIEDLKREH